MELLTQRLAEEKRADLVKAPIRQDSTLSYDLYFLPTRSMPSPDEFAAYFANRSRYSVGNGQALYQNDDTGVYFYFEYDELDDDGGGGSSIAFNLNYFRPHYFGLEAAPELEAFIEQFSLGISDPQTQGMGAGPFSVEGFLRGWNVGNRFAYRAILSSADRPDLFVYPTAALERTWKWNYGRASLQDAVGDSLFVPKSMFMKNGRRACTAVVWPDACPIYMPRCDFVFLLRDELSTNPSAEDPSEIAIVQWEQIAPLISAFPQVGNDVPYFQLVYDVVPDQVLDFVRSQPITPPNKETGLASDDVHNEELVAEALQNGG
jgi:hypothetical protein